MTLPALTEPLDPIESLKPRAQVARVVAFFEALSPASLSQLSDYYTPNAYFKDPFNEVRGLASVHAIFSHMYVALDQPRFVVAESIVEGDQCFLTWNFEFHFKNFDTAALQTVRGCSHLKFTADGLVNYHRDYWDAAEELYEKLPWVGGLMRWLKKRANQ
jgi:steroid Delta-isomerase